MSGIAVITEACIDIKDRACVDVCPVQCIYEFDPAKNLLYSEEEAGSGVIGEHAHSRTPTRSPSSATRSLYVNLDECTSCTACYQPDVCPVGAIYSEERRPRRPDEDDVQQGRPEQGPRPHVLHPAQPRRLRRLNQAVLPQASHTCRSAARDRAVCDMNVSKVRPS